MAFNWNDFLLPEEDIVAAGAAAEAANAGPKAPLGIPEAIRAAQQKNQAAKAPARTGPGGFMGGMLAQQKQPAQDPNAMFHGVDEKRKAFAKYQAEQAGRTAGGQTPAPAAPVLPAPASPAQDPALQLAKPMPVNQLAMPSEGQAKVPDAANPAAAATKPNMAAIGPMIAKALGGSGGGDSLPRTANIYNGQAGQTPTLPQLPGANPVGQMLMQRLQQTRGLT